MIAITRPNADVSIGWLSIRIISGEGLRKPMMTRAMQRLAESHPNAMLGTSTGRIWALKVYLDFGFYPDPLRWKVSRRLPTRGGRCRIS